ncbi:MAG: T9SS type A sorting domain-containing protein [Rhodothermales bacterium]
MKHSLRHLSFTALVLLTAAAVVPHTASAQVVFDTFDDGDVANVSAFSGGAPEIGAGVGPIDGLGGAENTGLALGINPGGGGGFAGAAVVLAAGVDASASEYLTLYVRPTTVQASNLPLTLEINLQEDADGDGVYEGATEDEYQANYRLSLGSEYELVQIPLASFADDNSVNAGSDDGFDFSRVINVVFAFGGIPAGPEFALAFDEIGFSTGMTVANESDASGLPDAIVLGGAYPNPFTSLSRFDVTVERAQSVRVEVFDVLGRRVGVLHEGTLAAQTPHTFEIDGQDLPSGMYLYRVTGETAVQTRSLVLLK